VRLRNLVLVVGATFAVASCSGDDSSTGVGAPPGSVGTTTTTEPAPEGCDPARAAEPGTVRRQLVHDGLERAYELSVPPGYDGEEPAPLLLDLHGFGSDGAQQNEYTGMPEAAGARGYVVVAPDGGPLSVPSDAPGGDRFDGTPFWNFFGSGEVSFGEGAAPLGLSGDASSLGADDVGFLTALVDELGDELCIDEARVYSTGMSNGAGMSTTLACEIGDRLAAIAPVAGVTTQCRCSRSTATRTGSPATRETCCSGSSSGTRRCPTAWPSGRGTTAARRSPRSTSRSPVWCAARGSTATTAPTPSCGR
jgi:polyhydroxybutyrate depolymerase